MEAAKDAARVEDQLALFVELATVVSAHAADSCGSRYVVMKGEVPARQGLRRERVSTDVDILVEPERLQAVTQRLAEFGWNSRPALSAAQDLSGHSVTMSHKSWPCDIDVHYKFPGFLKPPAEVFETLWNSREHMEFGTRECAVTSTAGSVLVVALHSLRSGKESPRHEQELEYLVGTCAPLFSAPQREEIAALAERTGCSLTLGSTLRAMGIAATSDGTALDDAEVRDWAAQVEVGRSMTGHLVARVRRAPIRSRPAILWRALWPSAAEVRTVFPEKSHHLGGVTCLRIRRLARGLRTLPVVLLGYRKSRRRDEYAGGGSA